MKKGIVGMVGGMVGVIAGAVAVGKVTGGTIDEKKKKIDKFKSYYNMLNQWLLIKQKGGSLDKYFKENGYHKIAIYGMGEMGERLYDELKNTEVKVEYAIDQAAESVYSELKVIGKEEDFAPVDAIIVTAVFAFDEIEEELREKVNCPILSLEDVVYEM